MQPNELPLKDEMSVGEVGDADKSVSIMIYFFLKLVQIWHQCCRGWYDTACVDLEQSGF